MEDSKPINILPQVMNENKQIRISDIFGMHNYCLKLKTLRVPAEYLTAVEFSLWTFEQHKISRFSFEKILGN